MTKARDLANGGFGLVLMKPSSVVNGTDNGKGTVSFSGASSVSLNDVFNTNYSHYRIIMDGTCTGNATLYFRYRVSGSDNTDNNNYSLAYERANYGDGGENGGPTTYSVVGLWFIYQNFTTIDVANPFLAKQKITNHQNFVVAGSAGNRAFRIGGATKDATTSFTGFTIYPSTGTLTGTISVYGLNK
jgi:hypothetical protein